jgi:pyrroline-5-carboxylate reductase
MIWLIGHVNTLHGNCRSIKLVSTRASEKNLKKIAVIGTGNMGAALVRGLVQAGKCVGHHLVVFDADEARMQQVASEFAVAIASSARSAVAPDTDILVLAVKPQIIGGVLDGIADLVQGRPLVVSIAAGISTEFILSKLPPAARVVRAMPNAAAVVGRSATALCRAGAADEADLRDALELFGAFGTARVVDEKMINVVTALASSGLAYLFVIMEALTDGGVLMGLDRGAARELVVQTVEGAAEMAAAGQVPFSELKDRITSPAGTTIAGLQVMERAGLRGALMDTIQAATRRAEELQHLK